MQALTNATTATTNSTIELILRQFPRWSCRCVNVVPSNYRFWHSIMITAIYVGVSVPVEVVLGFIAAWLSGHRLAGKAARSSIGWGGTARSGSPTRWSRSASSSSPANAEWSGTTEGSRPAGLSACPVDHLRRVLHLI
jgi:hypothetical protein